MSALTSSDRVRRRLNGQPVDRPPNFDIIMGFGAHHIGARLREYYLDYHTLARANLAMLQDFDLDLLQAISDPYREAADFGLRVEFPEDGLPIAHTPLIQDPTDLLHLRPPDPCQGRRMSDRLEAIRRMREQAGEHVPVMGWVEGALAEANDLRGNAALLLDLYDRPAWVADLLEVCTQVAIAFARAQVDAGADIIGLGDAVASTISPPMYRKFALPYEQRIFAAVRALGAIPRLHICGDTTRIVPDMAASSAAIIDLDSMVDLRAAAAQIVKQDNGGLMPVLCGNLDPVRLFYQGTPAAVYQATLDALEAGGPRCFCAAGCEIPDGTPHANLFAQGQAIKDYGAK
jgi:MtaA/CmuA family methyltransferase